MLLFPSNPYWNFRFLLASITLSNRQISDKDCLACVFCYDTERKYGGFVRLNEHALRPTVVLRKVKECENKANINFAREQFTFKGKKTEKIFSKN